MKSLIAIDAPYCGDALVDVSRAASSAIVVSEWDADTFHRRLLDLELQGYVVRRETYRVTPEMNPETGLIVHLHTVELYQAAPGRS
jgi:hypothetical protein